jgi:hypothetical protein
MTRLFGLLGSVATTFLVVVMAPSTVLAQPIQADVCEVFANPAKYDGRRIAVTGLFATDWHHAMDVMGKPCERGLMLAIPPAVANTPDWHRIEATKAQGAPYPEIGVSLVGVFKYDPAAEKLFFGPVRLLTVDTLKITS